MKNPFEPLEIKPLKKMWVCIGGKSYPDYSSISYTRTDSIKKCIAGTNWTWRKYKSNGWQCVKVNIEFDPL